MYLPYSKKHLFVLVALLFFINSAYSQFVGNQDLYKMVTLEKNIDRIKALNFLLENIRDKGFIDGQGIKDFDKLFDILESIQKKRRIENQDVEFQSKMDSLIDEYGSLNDLDVELMFDKQTLSAGFLSANIEYAFKVKSEKAWLKNVSDDIFFEYILPYRTGTERLEENWRESLYKTYNFIKKSSKARQETFNSTKSSDQMAFASDVQYEISRKISTNATMWGYPFDIPISKMERGRQGACRHLVNYTTSAMRSVGLAVTSDFTIRWGNNKTGHKWNVLFLENGTELPFDAANPTLSFSLKDRKIVKVYREQFSQAKNFIPPPESDVSKALYNSYWKDVTSKYINVSEVKIDVPKSISDAKTFVMIGTFDNTQWQPQFYAKIEKGKAIFKEMGVNNIFIGMYINNGTITTFGDPFKLDSLGHMSYLSSNGQSSGLKIFRKYPKTTWVSGYEDSILGGRFEASNTKDFLEKEIIHTIDFSPDSVVEVKSKLSAYRYFRFVFPNYQRVYISKISFFNGTKPISLLPTSCNLDKELARVNDGDLNNFYWGKPGGEILFDLGTVNNISAIKYAPRSDSNFIVAGDKYELCYWNKGQWVCLEPVLATSSRLNIPFVPQNCVYILHNLTKGKEERIFTYENDQQVWW